jgi:hypothetical protein
MADNHLNNLERAMNIAYENKDLEKAKIMAQEIEAYTSSKEKSLGGFAENVGEDAVNVGSAIGDMVANPLDTTGAIADLPVTAATNLLPKSLVDNLFSYENDPNSFQYKLNETLKNNSLTGSFFDFMATKPRKSYEQMGGLIADDVKALIDDPVGRMYEKPVTSLLEATGFGRIGTTIAKTGKFGNTAANVGNKVDSLLDYADPTKLVTKPIGILADKVKDSQSLSAATNVIKDTATDLGVKYGFKVTPSTLAEKGGNVLSRIGEKLVGKGKILEPVVKHNIKQADKLIRQHAGVSESTALGKIYDILAKKSKPFYSQIAKLEGKTKKVADNKVIIKDVKQKQRGSEDRTVQRQETIEKTKTVQDVESGQNILNKIEEQKKINKKAFKDSRKESSKVTQETLQENATKLDGLHAELDRTIAYNKDLARARGASKSELDKFDKMANNLKKARKNYAIGHSIENALNPDGTINLKKYANANRDNTSIKGSGRAVIDFYDSNENLFKVTGSSGIINQQNVIDAAKYVAAGVGTGGVGGPAAVYTAEKIIPSLLSSKIGQKLITGRQPTGSTFANLLSNQPLVRSGTIVPSLLDSSNIDYLQDLEYMK